MPIIARLIGGAGTGKTADLMRTMGQVIEAGVSPWEVGFVSFTRAARGEAAERAAGQFGLNQADLEKEGWFRTAHAICYRALGESRAKLLGGGKESREWMAGALQCDPGSVDTPEEADLSETFCGVQTEAGMALQLWHAARSRLEPLEDVWQEAAAIDERTPPWETVKDLVERYELHKRLDGRCDFTDLAGRFGGIRFGVEAHDQCQPEGDCPQLPVWFFDEQQDTSRLLDFVCRRLIDQPCVRWVYVAGDPFQSIYGWAGADSSCFREWEVHKERVMPQSYRCPSAILELGEAVLRECGDYFDRGISPAKHEGELEYQWWHRGAAKAVSPQDSWLLLARTNRLARQLAADLDAQGIPWAPTKGLGGWAAPKRNAALNALLALEQGSPIDREEWRGAIDLVPAKCEGGPLLVRGAKSQWSDKAFKPPIDLAGCDGLADWGATPLLVQILRSREWRGLVEGAEGYAAAVDRWGADAVKEPKVKVGTIHSVKGAEADNVLLLATSTHQCDRAMQNPRMADEERRVAYVGITRARRRLIIVKERNARFRMPI